MKEKKDVIFNLLGGIDGFYLTWIVDLGVQLELFHTLWKNPGVDASDLSGKLQLDPRYVRAWCRGAYAHGLIDQEADGYKLASHMNALLADGDSADYIGGYFRYSTEVARDFLALPRLFKNRGDVAKERERVSYHLATADYTRPFPKLIIDAFSKIEKLNQKLKTGTKILELGCGLGRLMIELAKNYRKSMFLGADPSRAAVREANASIVREGLTRRVAVKRGRSEDVTEKEEYGLILCVISLHEMGNIEAAFTRVLDALKHGGFVVVVEFPFQEELDDTVRNDLFKRLMVSHEIDEAIMNCSFLETGTIETQLKKCGFKKVTSFTIADGSLVVTHGLKP